jgi:hypothetical protein
MNSAYPLKSEPPVLVTDIPEVVLFCVIYIPYDSIYMLVAGIMVTTARDFQGENGPLDRFNSHWPSKIPKTNFKELTRRY